MNDTDETSRWEASWALAVGTIAGATLVGLAPAMLAPLTENSTFLGFPFGAFLAGIVVPPLVAAAIFWFAGAQQRIDRRFGAIED
jgi:putative solute:sodium symporter small subunit